MVELPENQKHTYAPGTIIFRLGEPSQTVFYIESGKVSVSLEYKERRFSIECGPGDMLGDAAFLFKIADPSETPKYGGTATAIDKVSLVALPREDLDLALENTPLLIRAWIASFANRTLKVIDALSN